MLRLYLDAVMDYTGRTTSIRNISGATAYSFGDEVSQLGGYAWFYDNATHIGEKYAHAVGTKKPNPWGLSDMHGNVWE